MTLRLGTDTSGNLVVPTDLPSGSSSDVARQMAAALAPLAASVLTLDLCSASVTGDSTRASVTVRENCAAVEWSVEGSGDDPEPQRAAALAVAAAVLNGDAVPIAALRRLVVTGTVSGAVVSFANGTSIAIGSDERASALVDLLGRVASGARLEVATREHTYRAARVGGVGVACVSGPGDVSRLDAWLQTYTSSFELMSAPLSVTG